MRAFISGQLSALLSLLEPICHEFQQHFMEIAFNKTTVLQINTEGFFPEYSHAKYFILVVLN